MPGFGKVPACHLIGFGPGLEVTLDQELCFSQHINELALSCYYQLRQLRVISRSLSRDTAVILIQAFVTSRLDHCSLVVPNAHPNHFNHWLYLPSRMVSH